MKANTWARMAMGWKCVAVLASLVLGSIWNILEQRFQRTAHDFSGVKDELQNDIFQTNPPSSEALSGFVCTVSSNWPTGFTI